PVIVPAAPESPPPPASEPAAPVAVEPAAPAGDDPPVAPPVAPPVPAAPVAFVPAVPPGSAVVGAHASPAISIAAVPRRAAILELWRGIGPPSPYSSGQRKKSSGRPRL